MPIARANHCAAFVQGWLVVVGGNRASAGGFVKTAEVDATRVRDDGSLEGWKVVGSAPAPVTECTAAASGDRVFVVDGIYDDVTKGQQVWSATVSVDGAVSPFTALGALPAGRRAISQAAWVRDATLYVTDAQLPDAGDTTGTLRTPLDGPLAWSTDDFVRHFLGRPQYAASHDFVWVLGGYGGTAAGGTVGDVEVAAIGAGGAVGPSSATTALPRPTTFGQAIAVDDWVFVVGGREAPLGGTARPDVVSASIARDGTLGAWTARAPLPEARSNFQLTRAGDFLIVTGGGNAGGGLDTVFAARVRF